jgi:hypothetical protein
VGFDLNGIQGKFNNVYADTEFYKKSTDAETYSGNWTAQLSSVISEHHYITFTRVVSVFSAKLDAFQKFKNYMEIGVRDFLNGINTTTK